MSETALVYYDNAKKALALLHRVDQIKDIRDKAEAMQHYARQAKDTDMINQATEVRLRAEIRAGELLAEMAERGERAKSAPETGRRKVTSSPKLSDLGVTKNQSSRWQKLASLSEGEQEARIAQAKGLAVAVTEGKREVVKAARAERQAEKRNKRHQREVELGARIAAMPNKAYGVIVADPPWTFAVSSEKGRDRSAENHYPTMMDDEIKALRVPAADDCVLFLWVTVPKLDVGLDVLRAWGFTYKSHFVWTKDKAGTGFWNSCQQWVSLQPAPVTAHSAKPLVFLQMIEELFPSMPKIELYARGKPRRGWTCWGNEVQAA